jgi:dienelactone hydrolase
MSGFGAAISLRSVGGSIHSHPAWFLALFLAVSLLNGQVFAQEESGRFKIRMRGNDAGSEEFKILRTPEGYRVTGLTRVNLGGQVEMTQDQSLSPEWNLLRYSLEASLGGRKQIIEASRDGDNIRMRAAVGDAEKAQAIRVQGVPVVLDNLIVAHFQVLLNLLKSAKSDGKFQFLVPQRLAAISGKLEGPSEDSGNFDGKPVRLRKFTLELASVLEEIWVEAESNRLMRVTVPMQNIEYLREGFSPAAGPANAETAVQGTETDVLIPSGSLKVPGTLLLPSRRAGPSPVVVMVHGSGPNDRDETIGPNKPFRDIAQALAAGGIATLRYDKRTFAFKSQIDMKTFTLDQEVTDDAVAALEYCLTRPEIDPARVFLLGHSLGATMSPFIAARFARLRGAVLLAGAARPLDELLIEQMAFQSRKAGKSETEVGAMTGELKAAFGRVRSDAAADNEMILFAPARYWRELIRLDIPKALSQIRIPILVLQGGKDVQVRKEDFDLIRKSLSGSGIPNHDFVWMPEVNHLFMEVAGDPSGAEYGKPGHVQKEAVDRIVAWVNKIGK